MESISCSGTITAAIKKDGSIWNSADEIQLQQPSEEECRTGSDAKMEAYANIASCKTAPSFQHRSEVDQVLLASGSIDEEASFLSLNDPRANQQAPDEPFSISVVTTGPYRAPAQVELVASVTHPENSTISKVEFYDGEKLIGTAIEEPYEIT